jgi:hypothetical protein
VSRAGRLADFDQDECRVRAAESKSMIADRHDARAAGAHHSHGTTRTQAHLAKPMDVVRLTIDL